MLTDIPKVFFDSRKIPNAELGSFSGGKGDKSYTMIRPWSFLILPLDFFLQVFLLESVVSEERNIIIFSTESSNNLLLVIPLFSHILVICHFFFQFSQFDLELE